MIDLKSILNYTQQGQHVQVIFLQCQTIASGCFPAETERTHADFIDIF